MGWTTSPAVSTSSCGYFTNLIGWYLESQINAFATKTYNNVPPFHRIRIWFRLIKIDMWEHPNEFLKVDVNSILRANIGPFDGCKHQYIGNQCGLRAAPENREHTEFVTIEFDDNTLTSLNVKLYSNLNEAANDESWAFTQFSISFLACHPTCKTCSIGNSNANGCLTCYNDATKQADNTCVCNANYITITSSPCTISPCTTCLLCTTGNTNRIKIFPLYWQLLIRFRIKKAIEPLSSYYIT